ncbi:MAG: putative metalloprotease CJM1_0395 family protein, partial [Alphaproteobacteria bacterium]
NRRPGLPTNGAGLTRQQVRILRWLKSRNGDVRRHEAAHYRTGRPYTALPVFDFVAGPDGRRYAISGHVTFRLPKNIGTGGNGLQILRRLRTAALAPRRPSARDREVAQALAVAIRQRRNRRVAR